MKKTSLRSKRKLENIYPFNTHNSMSVLENDSPNFTNIFLDERLANDTPAFKRYLNTIGSYYNNVLRVDCDVIDLELLRNKLNRTFQTKLNHFTVKQVNNEHIRNNNKSY